MNQSRRTLSSSDHYPVGSWLTGGIKSPHIDVVHSVEVHRLRQLCPKRKGQPRITRISRIDQSWTCAQTPVSVSSVESVVKDARVLGQSRLRPSRRPLPPCIRRARHAALLSIAVVLLAGTSARAAGEPPQIIRLIDTNPALQGRARIIDGVYKRVLPPPQARHVFQLGEVPPKPHLRLSMGLSPSDEKPPLVRFEVILLLANGTRKNLYSTPAVASHWLDADVDLSAYDLAGAQLVLRAALLEGDKQGLAVWGEPLLLSASRAAAARSVILISIDTLRADRLGIYGNDTAHTPVMDALARSGLWYTAAYSASTWTYPSHASLLAGAYPTALLPPGAKPPPDTPIPQSLAHWFGAAGYVTAGFTGGGFMSDKWGFPEGFDTFFMYEQPRHPEGGCPDDRLDGAAVFARAGKWLDANAAQPFFLFVHTYDVHDRCPIWPTGIGPFEDWPDPGPTGRDRLVKYYDSLLPLADALVGGLLSQLDKLGLADRTIVVLTGDHGEGFWEHGVYGHGCKNQPYEPLVHVPLILRVPGQKEHGPIEQPVSAVDVAPTVLSLTGVPRPATMQGYVLPGLGLDARPKSAPIYVHCGDQLAVRIGDDKLITAADKPAADQLFDLKQDPGETRNLIGEKTDVARSLRAEAARYRAKGWSHAGSQQTDNMRALDESTRERLRALGYLQ
jgi:arylsulfatase A-like enzyme